MAGPVLLVHDDIAVIAAVKRFLAKEGYEVILATNAADAVIGFGHYLPSLIVLAPAVEGNRGVVVLEELALHPDAKLARVLLLGETIPGFGARVVPLPLDGPSFVKAVEDVIRAPTDADLWTVAEHRRGAGEQEAVAPAEPESWRATAPPEVSGGTEAGDAGGLDSGEWSVASPEDAPEGPPELGAGPEAATQPDLSVGEVADAAFDDELKRLEEEVRAEAARRRQTRDREESAPAEVAAEAPGERARPSNDESSFAGFDGTAEPVTDPGAPEPEPRRAQTLQERQAALDAELDRLRAEAEQQATQELEAELFGGGFGEGAAGEPASAPLEMDPGGVGSWSQSGGESAEGAAEAAWQGEPGLPPPEGDWVAGQGPEAEPSTDPVVAANGDTGTGDQAEAELIGAEGAETGRGPDDDAGVAARAEAETAAAGEAEAVVRHGVVGGTADVAAEAETARAADDEAESADRAEAEKAAAEEAEVAARAQAEKAAAEEAEVAARAQAEKAAAEEAEAAARAEAEKAAAEEAEAAARAEAKKAAAEEAEAAARAEAKKAAAEEAEAAARAEAKKAAAEEAEAAVRAEAEKAAAEEAEAAVRAEAKKAAVEEAKAAARAEAEKAAVEEAKAAARAEAEKVAAEEAEAAAQLEAERSAAEEEAAARAEAARAAAEEAAAVAVRQAGEEAERLVAVQAAAREEAERLAAKESAARREAERLAAKEAKAAAQARADLVAAEKADEAARLELERRLALEAGRLARAETENERAREAAQRAEAALRTAEARAQAEIARLESDRASARTRADELAAAAAENEIETQAALDRVAELTASEQAANEATARALDAAAAAQRAADERFRHEREEKARLEQELETMRAAAVQERKAAEEAARAAEQARLEHKLEAVRAAAERERLAAEEAARAAERARAELELEAVRTAAEKNLAAAEKAARSAERERGKRELEASRAAEAERRAAEGNAWLAQEAARLTEQRRLEGALAEARQKAEEASRLAEAERSTREAVERSRAEADAAAQRAVDEANELAAKTMRDAQMPLEVPGRAPLGVPRSGAADPEQLAALVSQLCLARAEVRVELKGTDALRTLWLRRGTVAGATSSAPYESLLDRARRDGLIDGRQESELRLLRGASSVELLRVLVSRRYLREVEAVPLVQRFTEQIALEALSEPETLYRIAEEPAPDEIVLVAAPRPAVQLVAEALRRALTPDVMLEHLGGLGAVAEAVETGWDLRALGFSEKERKLLAAVDGQTTLEDLLLAAGLKQDAALRALSVAKALGLVALKAPVGGKPAPPAPEVDLRRLEAKFEEVQDADYFTILGLPRSAGSEEVERAFQQLAAEFHPLKFSGHPDGSLLHRAQAIHDSLAEAARALQDDRLRADYARNLLE